MTLSDLRSFFLLEWLFGEIPKQPPMARSRAPAHPPPFQPLFPIVDEVRIPEAPPSQLEPEPPATQTTWDNPVLPLALAATAAVSDPPDPPPAVDTDPFPEASSEAPASPSESIGVETNPVRNIRSPRIPRRKPMSDPAPKTAADESSGHGEPPIDLVPAPETPVCASAPIDNPQEEVSTMSEHGRSQTVISSDVKVNGTIDAGSSNVLIEGHVTGTVRGDTVSIDNGGVVSGDVEAKTVKISKGSVIGTVRGQMVLIEEPGGVEGVIRADSATIHGHMDGEIYANTLDLKRTAVIGEKKLATVIVKPHGLAYDSPALYNATTKTEETPLKES